MATFELISPFSPQGDQPQAIEALVREVNAGKPASTLLGVTGSGKTFTIANLIARVGKPTLVISHNKTLAAQLYSEFKSFFPHNAVEYFISYYDYYQPEAYIPQTDTYIEKDAAINEEIDRLRLSATSSLMSRPDCIVVASVSCIYNLGSPREYRDLLVVLSRAQSIPMKEVVSALVKIHYERNDVDFSRGTFRYRGDVLDVFPAYKRTYFKIEFLGDRIERIHEVEATSGRKLHEVETLAVYPAKHFVIDEPRIESALRSIDEELRQRAEELKQEHKLLELQRLLSRTRYDMEMIRELGYCTGVENYSRHLSARPPGSRPYCLFDYFPPGFLVVIDESHVTVPQIRGMFNGDRARKEVLVEHGFRLPSCLDNRPLRFEEFETLIGQVVYVSATPSAYEVQKSGTVIEQVIRPTGLVDPIIEVRPSSGQVDDLMGQIRTCAKRQERVLVTTLTKRMSEDLTRYLSDYGIRVRYLHSEIKALERIAILRDLRLSKFDCLIGINLLREGIDLPEVSLVAILDADKEGFLRSQTSLIQVAGRSARNVNGRVILYADTVTGSMQRALEETARRRERQLAYNREHGITPRTIEKAIRQDHELEEEAAELVASSAGLTVEQYDHAQVIAELEYEMELAARNLQFERAIELRDEIKRLKKRMG